MFLLGRWKNYEDLEASLTIDELIATINALREKEDRDRKFLAAINGIDLDEEATPAPDGDITDLRGFQAQQEGFGIGLGLGYMEIDE